MTNPLCPHCGASTYKHTLKDDRPRYLCRIRKTKGCGKVITIGPSNGIGRPKRTDGLTAAEVAQKQRDQWTPERKAIEATKRRERYLRSKSPTLQFKLSKATILRLPKEILRLGWV